MQGLFIAVEGIDGSGKETLSVNIAHWFFSRGESVVLTQEPYSATYIPEIRRLLHKKDHSAQKLAELYARDRWAQVEACIKPALFAKNIVISKRYMYSMLAYQQAQGLGFEHLHAMHAGFPKPNIVFLLDIAAEDALKRIKHKSDHEVFEKLAFLKKVRQNYLDLRTKLPEEHIIVLKADQPAAKVFKDAIAAIQKIEKELLLM